MLQIGTEATQFEGAGENGNVIRLSDFSGKKLVRYFYPRYPKDRTPSCTDKARDRSEANMCRLMQIT